MTVYPARDFSFLWAFVILVCFFFFFFFNGMSVYLLVGSLSLNNCCWPHHGPSPQVFLREAERQQLQASLHREVLRLIVMLQRQFRARSERKQFLRMREAAICIQVQHSAFHYHCSNLHLCSFYFSLWSQLTNQIFKCLFRLCVLNSWCSLYACMYVMLYSIFAILVKYGRYCDSDFMQSPSIILKKN